jgi:hypothetical protein
MCMYIGKGSKGIFQDCRLIARFITCPAVTKEPHVPTEHTDRLSAGHSYH